MGAARILALRGFNVALYEKEDRLDGQLSLYRDPYKLRELRSLIDSMRKR